MTKYPKNGNVPHSAQACEANAYRGPKKAISGSQNSKAFAYLCFFNNHWPFSTSNAPSLFCSNVDYIASSTYRVNQV